MSIIPEAPEPENGDFFHTALRVPLLRYALRAAVDHRNPPIFQLAHDLIAQPEFAHAHHRGRLLRCDLLHALLAQLRRYARERHIDNAVCPAERSIPPPLLTRADITGHSLADAVQRIVRQIPPRAEVYIDTTGSFRNASYILLAVVRILEYSGIHCVKAVYSNYHASPRRIEDVTNAYRLFDLINAANSFTAFGNSTELERFFREKDNPRIRRVVTAMKDFSKAVAMCRTSGLDGILAEMNESLSEIDAMEPRTEEEVLFCSISGLIRQKFGIPSPGGKIEYPEIIRWCLSNQMIQQAVTIYIEKIPAYLLEKRYFTVSEAIRAHAEANRGVYDFAYHVLYKEFMQMQSPIAFFLQHSTAAQRRAVADAASSASITISRRRRAPMRRCSGRCSSTQMTVLQRPFRCRASSANRRIRSMRARC